MDAIRGGTTLALYSSKLGLDVVSSVNFCGTGEDPAWCAISVVFTALPSVIVNVYLLYLLYDRPSFSDVYKKVLLCMVAVLQLLPFIWLVMALVILCGSNNKHIDDIRKTILAILSLQGILECVPQLSLQSYVVMKQYQNSYYNETSYFLDAVVFTSTEGSILDDWRYIVLLVNLGIGLILVTYAISAAASYTAGYDTEDDEDEGTLEVVIRIALYLFPFIGVGTRVFISGVLGTYNAGFWFIPVSSALLLSAISNYIIKKDKTWDERLLDSLFNTTGNFLTKSSVPASFAYFVSATVIFALNIDDPLCISAFSLGLICFILNIIMAALQHFLK